MHGPLCLNMDGQVSGIIVYSGQEWRERGNVSPWFSLFNEKVKHLTHTPSGISAMSSSQNPVNFPTLPARSMGEGSVQLSRLYRKDRKERRRR